MRLHTRPSRTGGIQISNSGYVEDTVALVLAAGSGTRLGMGPKAFLRLGERTLLAQVVEILSECVGRILVGVPSTHMDKALAEVGNQADVYPGGASRHATILTLFERTNENLVLIHDVARPFISKRLVRRVLGAAQHSGAATAIANMKVPMATIKDDAIQEAFPRFTSSVVQTPNVFQRSLLQKALQFAHDNNIEGLTPFELLIAQGIRVQAVSSGEHNIKITSMLDWEIASRVIAPRLSGGQEQ